jgi:glycosyltransferase involved in cell wall biosynthesis
VKILYYSAHPHLHLDAPSGPGTHMREMIAAFRRAGHEVEALVLGSSAVNVPASPGKPSSIKKLVRVILPRFVWETLKDLQLLRHDRKCQGVLEKKIAEFSPDAIYERGYYMVTSGIRAAKKFEKKHILEMNAPYIEEKKAMSGNGSAYTTSAKRKEREQVELTDLLVVVSGALGEYYSEQVPGADKKICVVPNAVDPEKVKVNETRVGELKKEIRLTPADLVVGFVGSIFPYHGVEDLVRAFAKLGAQHRTLKLLVVGDGETLPQIKKIAVELGISDRTVFTGNVPGKEVFNYISLMDITVLARSAWYMSPIKIFEYGIMGKAVVAIETKPVQEVMENGKDGLLVNGNKESLHRELDRLVKNDSLRKELGENFRKKVQEHYTWDIASANILEQLKRTDA